MVDPQEKQKRVRIGWREYVALPDWNIALLLAKADTGARSSAVDVANLVEIAPGRVRFEIVVDRRHPGARLSIEADVSRRAHVRSSLGTAHDRLFVRTTFALGPVRKEIELGLVCRRSMQCRMLIGRAALQPDFVVDPAARYRFGRRRRR